MFIDNMSLTKTQSELTMTENAQPAILAHSVAVFRVLQVAHATQSMAFIDYYYYY